MDIKQLRYMVNQIARNLAVQGDEAAIAATAQHIREFWEPRMKAALFADDLSMLDPAAKAAVESLSMEQ